jgi:photosystem II stability/assembly factor-like uncharacterized protein
MRKSVFVLFLLSLPIISRAQWLQTNLDPGAAYYLFSDDSGLYAGTETGVYFTSESGDPWFSIGPEDLIFSVITSGNKIIAGSGIGKGIWLSTDRGKNWDSASGILDQSIYTLCQKDNYLFAGTWGGGVFRSSDQGDTWNKVGLDGEPVEAIFSTGDTVFAGGADYRGVATVSYSTDNGDSWVARYLPYPASRIRCFAYKNGRLFAGGDGGLYASDDSGNNWFLLYGVTFDSLGNVIDGKIFRSLAVYDQYLIAGISFNSIRISADNGLTWSDFNDGLYTDWTFLGLTVKDSYLWSLRDFFGNAYRRPLTDLVTSLPDEALIVPSENKLYQNFPNPFNPSTRIRYQVHQKGFVSLKIYNILGCEIATLVEEDKPQGAYEVNFSSAHFSSGIYFYSLRIGRTFVETKWMLLLR